MENKKAKKLIEKISRKENKNQGVPIKDEDLKWVNRHVTYNIFPIDPQTGFLAKENFNFLKKPVANTSKEYILRNAISINDNQIDIGLNSTEMCILVIRNNDINFSKNQVLFIEANQQRFIEKQSEFINNLKTKVESLQPGDCVHICVGSTEENQEKPGEKRGHVADLCFYRNNNGVIDYFVYDPKGKPGTPSRETNLTKDLSKIIKGIVIPEHNIDLSNNQTISSKYFSIGAQLNVGNCAINVVNFVKSFEDQRNGKNIENILNNKTEKAVILFETAIGTEKDTNLALSQRPNFEKELLKPTIKTNIGEGEENKYCKVSINETGKSYYVPKERIKDKLVPEGINGISCNRLLMSVGVKNVAIEAFSEQLAAGLGIIITDTTIDYYIDEERLSIETLKQSNNDLNISSLLEPTKQIPVRKQQLSSVENSQPSEIAKSSSSDEQLTLTPQSPPNIWKEKLNFNGKDTQVPPPQLPPQQLQPLQQLRRNSFPNLNKKLAVFNQNRVLYPIQPQRHTKSSPNHRIG